MLLDLLIKFQSNPYFNSIVDKHLCTLIEKGIDLKDYFDSTLPIFQIKNEEYPSLHEDDTTKIYAVNVEKQKEIFGRYDDLIGNSLYVSGEEDVTMVPIEYHMINLPVTLTSDPKRFINSLTESDKVDLYENLTI